MTHKTSTRERLRKLRAVKVVAVEVVASANPTQQPQCFATLDVDGTSIRCRWTKRNLWRALDIPANTYLSGEAKEALKNIATTVFLQRCDTEAWFDYQRRRWQLAAAKRFPDHLVGFVRSAALLDVDREQLLSLVDTCYRQLIVAEVMTS